MNLNAEQLASLRQAAHWFSQLNSGEVQASDYSAWQLWLNATPVNAWAWQQAERLQTRMAASENPASARVLALAAHGRNASRRRVVKAGLILLGGGTLGLGGYREVKQSPLLADVRTGVGEQRSLMLSNGTALLLNTASAVDVDDALGPARLLLRQGEVMVTVPARQHCTASTRNGTVEAGESRFALRLFDDGSSLEVFARQARVTLNSGQTLLVNSGERCRFNDQGFAALETVPLAADAWGRGLLIANDQRLDAFISNLSRYRPGWLRCAPAVAGLRISGTYRLDDTDQILRALTTSLPVQVQVRTRFWVTITAA
ncbi:iron dicitrate transport regulator FecR [Pseudomonas putida]|uniref:Iron dicitrate transport regulator FecR n=1 Tax=Pseudomonas putida TaxID=303 RepID=A0A1Y3L6L0_PSEPU|nr:FecR domain-containing protein [Pseudomonas putida]OUM33034.1 iron dicitrate transport regulator FecR [Pseudomonas putida]